MNKNTSSYPLKIPHSIKQAAQRLAKEDGVSLNQWISVAIAEKIGTVQMAKKFLEQRAGQSTPMDLMYYLDRAAHEAPQDGD